MGKDQLHEAGKDPRSWTSATVRRLARPQRKSPGKSYAWQNVDFSAPGHPKVIGRGAVVADKYGLVTVVGFKVGTAGLGNRLVIRPAQ